MKHPLAELVTAIGSSLHAYLAAARVWTFPGDESIKLALVDLADDLRSISDRACERLEASGDEVPRPAFPIQFTATHDVDLGSLLPRILDGLRSQVASLDRLVDGGGDADDVGLVREARAAALHHADVLEGIARSRWKVAPATPS